ncbi:HAD family hydrolase [Halobellus sp. Atlit-31R]|nr:HAD family hydrolase [Halobellus sp. Atlit-31R]
MTVTFDLFGTLVAAERPRDPAAAVAAELRDRGVTVPGDWETVYAEPHLDAPDGTEVSLPDHVAAALRARDVDVTATVARRAVAAAFDPDVRTLPGAVDAVDAAGARGPVGLLSNCSVPELVPRALRRAALDPAAFDAVVTSVGCGWRKPHRKAFEAVAAELGVDAATLVHIGDDPATDGGVEAVGGAFRDVTETSLGALAAEFRGGGSPRSRDPVGGESGCR